MVQSVLSVATTHEKYLVSKLSASSSASSAAAAAAAAAFYSQPPAPSPSIAPSPPHSTIQSTIASGEYESKLRSKFNAQIDALKARASAAELQCSMMSRERDAVLMRLEEIGAEAAGAATTCAVLQRYGLDPLAKRVDVVALLYFCNNLPRDALLREATNLKTIEDIKAAAAASASAAAAAADKMAADYRAHVSDLNAAITERDVIIKQQQMKIQQQQQQQQALQNQLATVSKERDELHQIVRIPCIPAHIIRDTLAGAVPYCSYP
jgi:hypothetical protein